MHLSSLFGMTKQRTNARIIIQGCANSGLTFPHTLLHGLGGSGKTALARAISKELKYHFVEVLGSVFKRPEGLVAVLKEHSDKASRQRKPLLFFIDEIHQLSRALQESLYLPMKEWKISTANGHVPIPKFTLMGATTRFDMLDANSFVTRFVNKWELDRYTVSEVSCIVAQQFRKKKMIFNGEITLAIARRCLGIPRNGINLVDKLEMVTRADNNTNKVLMRHVQRMFDLEELDKLGLSPVHHRYLRILDNSRNGGDKHSPLGVGAIASKMRQPEDVIKGSVEPILFELNFVLPTPRGRMISDRGSKYLAENS